MQAFAKWIAVATAVALTAGCGKKEEAAPKAEPVKSAATTEPLKIGFVYVSPVGDAGWTTQHNAGREQMAKALGPKVSTSFVEKVPEGADAERVIRDLRQGTIGEGVEGGHEPVRRHVRRAVHRCDSVNPASHTEFRIGPAAQPFALGEACHHLQ